MNLTIQSLGKKKKLLATTKINLGSENEVIDRLNNVINDSCIPIYLHTLALKNLTTFLTFHHSLLAGLDIKFNVLGITETRLKLNSLPTSTFEQKGYIIKLTTTELRILTGKKHPKIKLQHFRKIRIWTFRSLVRQTNTF